MAISIHALREEGDLRQAFQVQKYYISIHALREEGDVVVVVVGTVEKLFLSTPSARRATGANKLLGGNMAISIHALREEGDGNANIVALINGISIHALREEGDRQVLQWTFRAAISIHALREEGDYRIPSVNILPSYFYPRPPRGGRLTTLNYPRIIEKFLSTPSARRATPVTVCRLDMLLISIHALREEGDPSRCHSRKLFFDFYPRPPRGGRLRTWQRRCKVVVISIHALREEGDAETGFSGTKVLHFYPRPPRGGRPSALLRNLPQILISIHALREEGDGRTGILEGLHADFYPRPPRGGRRNTVSVLILLMISIHALREEGDPPSRIWLWNWSNFYPRPPRGGRPFKPPKYTIEQVKFLSTPSARRATCRSPTGLPFLSDFYPRPPRGGRLQGQDPESGYCHFYPRPPRGGRLTVRLLASLAAVISIHALREEGDATPYPCFAVTVYFYPRPPRGGRQQKQRQNLYFQTNYTTFCTNLEEP